MEYLGSYGRTGESYRDVSQLGRVPDPDQERTLQPNDLEEQNLVKEGRTEVLHSQVTLTLFHTFNKAQF